MNDVLKFIKNFHGSEDVFMYGCCYWFAFILSHRFNGKIYYDPIKNHFVTKIDGRFYDVMGEVEIHNSEDVISWESYKEYDSLDYDRVVKYCVLKD